MKQNLKFGLVLGLLAVLKLATIKLKYATFEDNFIMLFEQYRVRTKKLHYIKVKKHFLLYLDLYRNTSPRDVYIITLGMPAKCNLGAWSFCTCNERRSVI